MNFLENIMMVWQKLGLVQKTMLLAIVFACVITGVFLTKWAGKPEMRPLYTGISAEDAGKICDKIAEKGIAFELRGTGNIYVPKEHIYQLNADLAKDGLPGEGSKGYKLFDEGGFATSPFVQDINKTRALQHEIAKSIQMFDSVMHAKVLIVRPEQNVFDSSAQNSTASIMLQLRPGYQISQSTVAAITHMAAGSVEGLSTEGVTIVDSEGRLLSTVSDGTFSSGANTFIDMRERVEQNLADRAERLLETALGPGRSSIVVSAILDMDSEDTLITTYDKGVAQKEEINTITKLTGGQVDEQGNPIVSGDEEGEEKIVTEMLVPETTKKTKKLAGKILSISVAAVVDLTAPAVVVEAGEGEDAAVTQTTQAAATKIMTIEQVENLIFSAIGRDLLKKENLSVVDTPFNRPPMPKEIKVPWHQAYIGIIKQGSLGFMALCALLALKIFSGKFKAVAASASPTANPAQIGGSDTLASTMLPSADMREQISQAFRSDPEQVRELFTSWIEEKG